MYDSIRRGLFWPHMANDVYSTVSSCCTCTQNGTSSIFEGELQMFPASSPLKFCHSQHFWTSPSHGERKRVQVRHDWQARKAHKSNASRPDIVVTSRKRVVQFLDNPLRHPCLRPCGKRYAFQKQAICVATHHDWRKDLTTTAYHPQTNGQVKRHNHSMVKRAALIWREPKGFGHIRATINVGIQSAGAQVHINDPFQTDIIVAPAWTNNRFPFERVSF